MACAYEPDNMPAVSSKVYTGSIEYEWKQEDRGFELTLRIEYRCAQDHTGGYEVDYDVMQVESGRLWFGDHAVPLEFESAEDGQSGRRKRVAEWFEREVLKSDYERQAVKDAIFDDVWGR